MTGSLPARPCPICKKAVPPAAAGDAEVTHRPFCSQRCKLIDLGAWLDGAYRVDGGLVETGPEGDGSGDGGPDSGN